MSKPRLPAYLTRSIADLCTASQRDALACGGRVSMSNSQAHKAVMRAVRRFAGKECWRSRVETVNG